MILSSANILEILQGSAIIRMAASEIRVVDRKPIASGREGFYVHIEKYPVLEEFEATWRVWIESDGSEPDDLLFAEMRRLLPNFEFKLGLVIEATVRDFKSSKTEARPRPSEAPPVITPTGWNQEMDKRFESLAEDIQDRMLLVNSGRPGKDGERGPEGPSGAPGRDGRDGKDLVATDTYLDDLKDVEVSAAIPLERGQVLTYDGVRWTNLYTKQTSTISGGGGGSTTLVTGQIGSTIVWQYHEETGEPHARKFHTNGEDQADQVTQFHVSKTNEAGNDTELLLDALLPLTGQLYVASEDDPSQAHLYSVSGYTETTSGFQVNVNHIDTPGPEPAFSPNHNYSFFFLPSTSVTGGIAEAPQDGGYYVRHNGQWVDLSIAFGAYDGRDFDGGNYRTGLSDAFDNSDLDGGEFTP